MLLELDEQLLLVLTDVAAEASPEYEVVLRFRQATLDWQEYGNLAPHASIWRTGTVVLSAQYRPPRPIPPAAAVRR